MIRGYADDPAVEPPRSGTHQGQRISGNKMTEWSSNIAADVGASTGPAPAALKFEEAALLARCRDGDMSAFGSLVGRYQDRVYNSILRLCGNADDAEELCQESFVKALENLPTFRQASGFYTWLFRIAMNLAISHRRRGGRVKFHSLDPTDGDGQSRRLQEALPDRDVADPGRAAMQSDTNSRVIKALEELDEEFGVVVVLRDIEEMNYDEISQVLGIPAGTVKSRLYRARCMLQEKLKDVL